MQEYKVTAGGTTYPLGPAFLRSGDAKPHRAGRHLPASRSPARPLHAEHRDRLSRILTTKCRSSCRQPPTANRRRTKSWKAPRFCATRNWCGGCPSRPSWSPTRSLGAALAAEKRRRPPVRQGLRRMGRRPARFAVSDPRRQGAHDLQGRYAVRSKIFKRWLLPCSATASFPTSRLKAKDSPPATSSSRFYSDSETFPRTARARAK